ncbi:MAG: hypothetical protein ACK2UL_03405 [Anaerolineae bacterium]
MTFLFTGVEASTRMFKKAPKLMLEALAAHDATVEAAAHGAVTA